MDISSVRIGLELVFESLLDNQRESALFVVQKNRDLLFFFFSKYEIEEHVGPRAETHSHLMGGGTSPSTPPASRKSSNEAAKARAAAQAKTPPQRRRHACSLFSSRCAARFWPSLWPGGSRTSEFPPTIGLPLRLPRQPDELSQVQGRFFLSSFQLQATLLRADSSQCSAETKVVSTAIWAPPKRGNPSAKNLHSAAVQTVGCTQVEVPEHGIENDSATCFYLTTNLRQKSEKLVHGSLHLLAPRTSCRRCGHRIPSHIDLRACCLLRTPG